MKNKILIDISVIGYLAVSNAIMFDLKKDYLKDLPDDELEKEKEKIIFEKLNDKNVQKNILSHMYNKLNSIIRDFNFQKEDITICFDSEDSYWREKIYPEYKKNRKLTFEKEVTRLLLTQFYDVLKISDFNVLKSKGIEADEMIYFLSKKFHEKGKKSTIFSIDGDMHQIKLTVPEVEFISPRLMTYINYDIYEVKKEFLNKLIIGDRKDNIVGIKLQDNITDKKLRNLRFGEKTIQDKFGTILKDSPNDIEGFNKTLDEIKELIVLEFSKNFPKEAIKIKENFELNQSLINLSLVPEKVEKHFFKDYEKSFKKNSFDKQNDYEKSIILSQYLNDNNYKSLSNLTELPYLFNTNSIDLNELKKLEYIILKTNKKEVFLKPDEKVIFITSNEHEKNERMFPLELKKDDSIFVEYTMIEKGEEIKKLEEFKVFDIIYINPNLKSTFEQKMIEIKDKLNDKELQELNLFISTLNIFKFDNQKNSSFSEKTNNVFDMKDIFLLESSVDSFVQLHFEKNPKVIEFFEKYNPNDVLEITEQIIKQSADKKIRKFQEEMILELKDKEPKSSMKILNLEI